MNSKMTKRQFLRTTAAATVLGSVWEPVRSLARADDPIRWRLNLNGPWEARQADGTESIKATVPGCIHTDLMAAGKIPDPFFRDNEQAVQWVSEKTWVYRRAFHVPDETLRFSRVLLRCEGLDTLAAIKINGQEVGQADNMFRLWEFDAKGALRAGENEIEITFRSPLPLMRERQAKRPLYEWIGSHEPQGRAWVRKEPCNFGWDWGPVLITCGIWRGISLEALNHARLRDVLILQDHSAPNRVTLSFQVTAEAVSAGMLQAAIMVRHKGETVAKTKVNLSEATGRATVELNNPRLWWPAGMGEAALYEVRVELRDAAGKALDTVSRRIGLRTLKLLEKDDQNSLRFEANGVPFFSKGANWIPADAFATRVTPAILRRCVADAAAVNMNTLRFWGGGYYEDEALLDACDETGLCVWLDFKFACSAYPAFDGAFMENVRLEARDNLRRLRDHPCIAVWCGNNEISLMTKEDWSKESMGRADYDKLFKGLLAGQVKECAPQANYVSGSPDCGDTHYWQVWHGGQRFEAYRSLTGFMSEFGFQSFPEPRTVRSFTAEEDRGSLVTPVLNWHQRSPKGNEKIRDMINTYFNPPKDWESALWLSQILQGLGIKLGAEYWRQTMPQSMGCVFWQYNDCWPVVSWSSVDYFGRWKALHYMARRFYAPILVSGLENPQNGAIDVFVTSDRLAPCRGTLAWQATDLGGRLLRSEVIRGLDIPARQSQKVKTLDLADLTQARGLDNVLTWLKVIVDGRIVSDNLISFVLPKDLNLGDPRLKAAIAKDGKKFRVTLAAEQPALWTWLSLDDSDAKYSDNFVHVAADAPAQIVVTPERPMTQAQFTRALRLQSLFDTYKS
jgi:beta-mannosidase